MSIQVGDTLPKTTLYRMAEGGPVAETFESLFGAQRVVLFAVPGAFTPTCSQAHLPGFVANADKIKAKGVDRIICLSVNDAFVMNAWGEQHNADNIDMIADGNADFVKALGLDLDVTSRGMGIRARRFALIANNGVTEWLGIEDSGQFEKTSAEAIMAALQPLILIIVPTPASNPYRPCPSFDSTPTKHEEERPGLTFDRYPRVSQHGLKKVAKRFHVERSLTHAIARPD